MKKSWKTICEIAILLLILGVIYYVFFYKNNNNKNIIDSSDLVCTRSSDASGISIETKTITFKFDKKSVIEQYEEKYISEYYQENDAKMGYEVLISSNSTSKNKILIDGNKVIFSKNYFLSNDKNADYYGKTKKEIIKIFKDEYYYDCK